MAQIYTIDKIEGNSFIGVPVFSRFGMMQNYNYIVLSPQKKHKAKVESKETTLHKENLKFKIDAHKAVTGNAGESLAETMNAI